MSDKQRSEYWPWNIESTSKDERRNTDQYKEYKDMKKRLFREKYGRDAIGTEYDNDDECGIGGAW